MRGQRCDYVVMPLGGPHHMAPARSREGKRSLRLRCVKPIVLSGRVFGLRVGALLCRGRGLSQDENPVTPGDVSRAQRRSVCRWGPRYAGPCHYQSSSGRHFWGLFRFPKLRGAGSRPVSRSRFAIGLGELIRGRSCLRSAEVRSGTMWALGSIKAVAPAYGGGTWV